MKRMIQLRDVSRSFRQSRRRTVRALYDVSLTVDMGDYIAVSGTSGSGKSTLLSVIGLLLRPSRGSVIVDDVDVASMRDVDLTNLRSRKFGFVFQSHNLLPGISVVDNVALPLKYAGIARRERTRRAHELLTMLGLRHLASESPGALSGGEQQRVGVARALANEHEYILADEPTGSVDSANTRLILDCLEQLNSDRSIGIVIVSHDESVAARARTRYEMIDGGLSIVL